LSTPSSNLDLNLGAYGASAGVPAWKHELNERLQATRVRRTRRAPEQVPLPTLEQYTEEYSGESSQQSSQQSSKTGSRASRLAAKVAERYAKAPSYSEVLAAEARAAAAAAEAALSAAQDAHAAAQALLAGLETPQPAPVAVMAAGNDTRSARHERDQLPASDRSPQQSGSLEPLHASHPVFDSAWDGTWDGTWDGIGETPHASASGPSGNLLDDAMVLPAQPLPVNLIEFPRELVAARKARPRLAEGPLRDDYEEAAHDQSQLRIFEVESESISKEVKIAGAAEWSSIRLDAKPTSPLPGEQSASSLDLPLKAAPLEDRLMAGIFDLALVLFSFVLFVLVFAACTAHPPTGKPALFAGGLVLAGLFLLYQFLFFRFTEGTPGMHYAKIALCTFEDENPTRKAMRRRILFLLLSAAPLGLGFAWAWFDADRLGWHDRLTKMYQRSYR
jgi:uncharacterized RDD family membrane protein YckC